MHLLERINDDEFSMTKDFGDDFPRYAILSHTWGADTEEVTFKDLIDGTGMDKAGYNKIRFCGEQARRDGLQYFWVDTCCIDKSNSTKLAEAINSMFRWYQNAAKCYVYLVDVSIPAFDTNDESSQLPCESALRESRWFTRGWTLQELLAPSSVEFFSREGNRLGDRRSLEQQIHEVTGIAVLALRGTPLSQFGVHERFSWADNRQTTRKEDKAYSLLGIFNVYMPLIYGEGSDNAFARLREEIDKPSKGLDCLMYAVEAPFNSYAKQHSPSCLPNTRVELLREIYSWANGQDERCIFWLNGLAGTGKSTISRTVARKWYKEGSLGASFFFSRGGGDVGHARKFVTSIVVQLASSVPTIYQFICDAIMEHSDITSRSLHDQWQLLVLDPLSKLDGNSCRASYVLVVDAVDECDDDSNIRIILQLLAETRSLKRVRLRVFLTSRPEVPIRYGFCQIPDTEYQDFVLHNISPSVIDHDIFIFLEYNLGLIGQERSLDAAWPGEDIIKYLVQIASGLFIWAATACRFIREGKRFAAKRLNIILKGSRSTVTAPEKHLNEIYMTVLKHSVSPEYTDEEIEELYYKLRQILGSIAVLFSPLSTFSLSRLLYIAKEDIDQTLEDLHSVLGVPKDQTQPLRLHHPSFRDFLLDKDRCSDSNFLVDEKQAHRVLASSCIQLMSNSLRQGVCGQEAPGTLVADVESSRIEHCLPPEVRYACLYWVQHLQKSSIQLCNNDEVYQFLQVHLLHWLEALSWIGKTSEGILGISSLEALISVAKTPDLHAFIHDAKRFTLYNRSVIEQAPFQIYCSALVFAPEKSIVRRRFEKCIPPWIQTKPKVQVNWDAALQTLEGHTGWVSAIAFSPDGKQLASGSKDRTVRLWDAATGTTLQALEGHTRPVSAVVFSPDGKQLASGSNDRTVRLWDAATGTALQALEGHTHRVRAVVFSPDGKQLASGSDDRTVRLWDAATGTMLQVLEGHSEWISAIAFSLDSKQLASGSYDQTVRLWDAATGTALQALEGHSRGVRAVVFSPDGKQLASGSYDQTVQLWDAATGTTLQTLEGHSEWVSAVVFSPDGKQLASGSNDKTVRLWDAATGTMLQVLEGHTRPVSTIAFSPDGKQLASGSYDQTVRLWDAATGTALQALKGHTRVVSAVVFSPDSKQLASGSYDQTVRLWDAAIGTTLQTLEGHSEWVSAVVFSPDGKQLASGSYDQTVRLWDAATGTALQALEGHTRVVRAVAFSPDSKQLASGSDDWMVRLWDAATGTALQALEGHTHRVRAVVFSLDGKQLASGSDDRTVRLWDAATGAMLQTLETKATAYTLTFSTDGLYLQTNRGTIQIHASISTNIPSQLISTSNMFIKDHWIGQGEEVFFWLPTEYRSSVMATYRNTIAIGCQSGRVLILEFRI